MPEAKKVGVLLGSSSLRHEVEIEAIAEVGAIAAVFSSTDDIAREASRLLLLKISAPALPNAAHVAEEFSVQLNRSVANAIGITLPVVAKGLASNEPQYYEAAAQ